MFPAIAGAVVGCGVAIVVLTFVPAELQESGTGALLASVLTRLSMLSMTVVAAALGPIRSILRLVPAEVLHRD